MKKLLSLLAVVFTLGLTTVALDAEAAKRLGGGKSVGTQRQATPPANAPTATPAATPAAAGAAAASNRSKWMGPIAGIAAGLGIAALASHLGFGEELASFMTMALIVMAVMPMCERRSANQLLLMEPNLHTATRVIKLHWTAPMFYRAFRRAGKAVQTRCAAIRC